MKSIKLFCAMFLFGTVIGCFGQTSDDPKPDNTKVNKRDRNAGEATADQQKNNQSDVNLSKQIRRSIVEDKSLSTYAHNIKIISQNGIAAMKGPVKSDEEKKAVMEKAIAVAGSADKVTDQISIRRQQFQT